MSLSKYDEWDERIAAIKRMIDQHDWRKEHGSPPVRSMPAGHLAPVVELAARRARHTGE